MPIDLPGQAGEQHEGNDHSVDAVRYCLAGEASSVYHAGEALRCSSLSRTAGRRLDRYRQDDMRIRSARTVVRSAGAVGDERDERLGSSAASPSALTNGHIRA
jgi:hypothetical protein